MLFRKFLPKFSHGCDRGKRRANAVFQHFSQNFAPYFAWRETGIFIMNFDEFGIANTGKTAKTVCRFHKMCKQNM